MLNRIHRNMSREGRRVSDGLPGGIRAAGAACQERAATATAAPAVVRERLREAERAGDVLEVVRIPPTDAGRRAEAVVLGEDLPEHGEREVRVVVLHAGQVEPAIRVRLAGRELIEDVADVLGRRRRLRARQAGMVVRQLL
jgi:hypothetical protein